MQVSVIIPVFNSEKYLKRCLDSVVKALNVFGRTSEILAIDNNSTDSSLIVLQKYAEKYPDLFRVMQCSTPGAAAVRNFGVMKARGKYIWFVDADDEITKESVSKLFTEAESRKADIVSLGLTKIYPDGHKDYIHAINASDSDFCSKFIRREPGPVQVLIRREWYKKHGFMFLEGGIHEDMEMMPALILYTDKFGSVDEPLYLYYQNCGSVLHPTEWSEHYFDIFPALEGLYGRFKKAGAVSKYHDELEWFFIWNLLMDSAEYFRMFPQGRPGLLKSRKMLRRYFPNWWHNKFLGKVNLRTRLKIYRNYF
ncbi:glycosyltransferase family 2 protein [Candidatus Saccharibacteria bacterium]|nr:glycosyltransferase family 2 protein [Candidatus Saccharibacteria bacterium]